jgi:hypothetical protein
VTICCTITTAYTVNWKKLKITITINGGEEEEYGKIHPESQLWIQNKNNVTKRA